MNLIDTELHRCRNGTMVFPSSIARGDPQGAEDRAGRDDRRGARTRVAPPTEAAPGGTHAAAGATCGGAKRAARAEHDTHCARRCARVACGVAQQIPENLVQVLAVELEEERMVVLGRLAPDFDPSGLRSGAEVAIELGVLYEDDEHEYVVWQWRPVEAGR